MSTWVSAQDQQIVLEELAAKLGGEILLSSELLSNLDYQTAVTGGLTQDDSCQVIQSMFMNKLMVDQAKLDSIVVPDAQVEQELDRKIQYIIQTMNGDIERFQNYYGKNVSQVKKMMRKDMKEQALARQMQRDALRLRGLARSLEMVSPLATVTRGYAIVQHVDGRIVRSVLDATAGDRLQARLVDGQLQLQVEEPDSP